MKRIGHLFDAVTSFENLMAAAAKARSGCGSTPSACRFFFHLEPEVLKLREALRSGAYRPGGFRYFQVHDPKKRTIAVAPFRDRVVHHAVVSVLTPIYEKRFIHDSYASRTGKGTHAAVRRAQRFMRGRKWYLKTDVDKFFDSVNHDILMKILTRKLKDDRLSFLLNRIVKNSPTPSKGLPIGNLTSQFLANVYLDIPDHFIKEGLHMRAYVRYMDDLVLFHPSREELRNCLEKLEIFLWEELKLTLKPAATCLNRSSHGLNFLGMRIFPHFIRVRSENRRRSLRRMQRRVEAWRRGELEEEKMVQSLTSIVAHLKHFCPQVNLNTGVGAD